MDDDIQDPLARKLRDWLKLTMGYGMGFVIATLTVLGCVWAAVRLVPAYEFKIRNEGELAQATLEAVKKISEDNDSIRLEYAQHEKEHVEATRDFAISLGKTNSLLEEAKTMMEPAVADRRELVKQISEQTRLLQKIADKENVP